VKGGERKRKPMIREVQSEWMDKVNEEEITIISLLKPPQFGDTLLLFEANGNNYEIIIG